MTELPRGTVTFLFTDVEGSTRLWEEHPETMHTALARHDTILRGAIESHDGHVVKQTGDGFHAVFADAAAAIGAARRAQLALSEEAWGDPGPLRVRMGIHTGPAELRDGDYYGSAVNRAARLMSVANGGQVIVSRATEELLHDSPLDGVELLDLGEHRLRDLARPEHVFQLAAPGLARDFPPLRTLDAYAGNLPAQVTSFIGREAEVSAVAGALADSRIVTITGVGGVGKTRLAVQVAAALLPRYPDGAWFCELATAEDEDTMLQVVAASLDVTPRPEMTLTASIIDALHTKRVLVVLDNCEHLLEGVGALVESILRSCPEVRVLVTSREVLSIPGERVVGLRSMSVPRDAASPDQVAASDAGQLFADRARAVRADFRVDDSNAAAVAEICRRLDGIPLAIVLAAARVAAMSPAEIASLLDERFRLLRGGRHTKLERHQTLRAAVDWSYSLLDGIERAVFDRLGVFAGAFDGADARAVVSGDGIEDWDVLDALAGLVAKSLLVADDGADGTTRYQMLETIRSYARERLDELEESDQWRRRHAEHFAAFAGAANAALVGPGEIPWRQRLRAAIDNIRAAVVWSLDAGTRADRAFALRIVANLAAEVTLQRRSDYGRWAERALPYVDEAPPGERAAVLGAAAFASYNRGDPQAAYALARRALGDGVPADCPSPSVVYVSVATSAMSAGHFDEAVQVLSRGLEDSAGEPDSYRHALLLAVRSIMEMAGGEVERARADATAALAESRRLGNPSQLAIALALHGAAFADGDPSDARAALEESLALVGQGASDVMLGLACQELARLRLRDGDATGALGVIEIAVLHSQADGDRPGLVGTVLAVGEMLAELGRPEALVVINHAVRGGELRALAAGMELQLAHQEPRLDHAREALGDAGFTAAAARGAAMSFDDVSAYALDAIDDARRAVPDGGAQVRA